MSSVSSVKLLENLSTETEVLVGTSEEFRADVESISREIASEVAEGAISTTVGEGGLDSRIWDVASSHKASADEFGVVKVGAGLNVSGGVVSTPPLSVSVNGKLFEKHSAGDFDVVGVGNIDRIFSENGQHEIHGDGGVYEQYGYSTYTWSCQDPGVPEDLVKHLNLHNQELHPGGAGYKYTFSPFSDDEGHYVSCVDGPDFYSVDYDKAYGEAGVDIYPVKVKHASSSFSAEWTFSVNIKVSSRPTKIGDLALKGDIPNVGPFIAGRAPLSTDNVHNRHEPASTTTGAPGSVQLGYGRNSTPNSLQFRGANLLSWSDATGHVSISNGFPYLSSFYGYYYAFTDAERRRVASCLPTVEAVASYGDNKFLPVDGGRVFGDLLSSDMGTWFMEGEEGAEDRAFKWNPVSGRWERSEGEYIAARESGNGLEWSATVVDDDGYSETSGSWGNRLDESFVVSLHGEDRKFVRTFKTVRFLTEGDDVLSDDQKSVLDGGPYVSKFRGRGIESATLGEYNEETGEAFDGILIVTDIDTNMTAVKGNSISVGSGIGDTPASIKKNGEEVATEEYVDSMSKYDVVAKSGTTVMLEDRKINVYEGTLSSDVTLVLPPANPDARVRDLVFRARVFGLVIVGVRRTDSSGESISIVSQNIKSSAAEDGVNEWYFSGAGDEIRMSRSLLRPSGYQVRLDFTSTSSGGYYNVVEFLDSAGSVIKPVRFGEQVLHEIVSGVSSIRADLSEYGYIVVNGETYGYTSGDNPRTVPIDRDSDITASWADACLSPDTVILTPHGNVPLKDIREGDIVTGVGTDGREFQSRVTRCDTHLEKWADGCDRWTFSGGSRGELVVTTVRRHRFYNVERGEMVYMDEWRIGEHGLAPDGSRFELLSREHVDGPARHMTLFTETQTYFAGGLLSGNRHTPHIDLKGDR